VSGAWREAYRLQRTAFPELAYHAIYSVRMGNVAPSIPEAELVRRSERRVLQSKLLVSALLGLLALGSLAILSPTAKGFIAPDLAGPLYVETVIVGLLVLELALLWWTGLQVLPTFLSSAIVPTLEVLPIPSKTLERASFLLFLRLFDLPAGTALVMTPIAVGAALGSVAAGIAIVPGTVATVVFGLGLSLVTGKFFLRHVQGASGGSSRSTAVRWAYLVLWTVPAFAMYGYVALGPRFIAWLTAVASGGPSGAVDALLATFPFPLASLPSLVASGGVAAPDAGTLPLGIVLVGSAAYGVVALLVGIWLLAAPRTLARTISEGGPPGALPGRLRTRSAPMSIVVKDLRISSRTPGFAFLVLLPLLDAIAIGVWTVLASPVPSDAFNVAVAAVATAALLATFFGPAFFAIEVMGYSYTRTLPLSEGSLLLGKVTLIAAIYGIAAGTVLAIALAKLFDPLDFVGFILAELPAVAAAALLELGILMRVARRRGLPITNLYSGSWWAIAVSVPGLLVAGLPLALFALARGRSDLSAIGLMGGVALVELALATGLAFLGSPSGAR